jgi:glycosyltransferase involved in cell wall biosynthesis
VARLIYTIFINNAFNFLSFAEACGAPMVFTLYPGGGFMLNNPVSDQKLRRVFSSKSFQSVIVTQPITRDYLLSGGFCPPEKVHYINGCVMPEVMFAPPVCPKRLFGVDKGTIDICFVANKYMPGGMDKGYDVFLAVARRLAAHRKEVRFHIVGPFDETDGDLSEIRDRVQFHGYMQTEELRKFYRQMDIILSPNAPFMLAPGGFDGFPTGCCIDAALCGVAVFCTDQLNLNTDFRSGDEIVLITRNADEVSELVDSYCQDHEKLYQLAAKGNEAFRRMFSPEVQLASRFAILDQVLR